MSSNLDIVWEKFEEKLWISRVLINVYFIKKKIYFMKYKFDAKGM